MERTAYMITMGIKEGESTLTRDELSAQVERWATQGRNRMVEELADPRFIVVYHFFLEEVLRTSEEHDEAIQAFAEFLSLFPQATYGDIYVVKLE